MKTRADQTHDLLETIFGELPGAPNIDPCRENCSVCSHAGYCAGASLHTDTHRISLGRNVVLLKPQRVQVEPAAGQPIQRRQPASCSATSTMGVRVGVVLGVVTIAAVSAGLLMGWL